MPSQVGRGVTLVAPRVDEPSLDWVRLSHNGMTLVCYMGGFCVTRLSQDLTRIGCSPSLRVTAVYYKACAQYRYEHTTLSALVKVVQSGDSLKPAVVVLDGMMPL
jgi:siroheme synthase